MLAYPYSMPISALQHQHSTPTMLIHAEGPPLSQDIPPPANLSSRSILQEGPAVAREGRQPDLQQGSPQQEAFNREEFFGQDNSAGQAVLTGDNAGASVREEFNREEFFGGQVTPGWLMPTPALCPADCRRAACVWRAVRDHAHRAVPGAGAEMTLLAMVVRHVALGTFH